MANPWQISTFNGHNIAPGSGYAGYFRQGNLVGLSAGVQLLERRASTPLVMGTMRNPREFIVNVDREPAVAAITFRPTVIGYFALDANRGGVRYLTRYHEDGTTLLRIGCYVAGWELLTDGLFDRFVVSLIAPDAVWEANTATTSATGPATVTNLGNAPAYPSVALTTSNHVTRRACTVANAGAGGGLMAYPIKLAIADAVFTALWASAYVEGVEVPFGITPGVSGYAWVLVDTASDGTTETQIDILYGTGRTGSALGTLNDGGMNWASSSCTNNNWIWDEFLISTYPARCGTWRPARTGNHRASGVSFGISAEAAGGVTFALGTEGQYDNSADSMVLVVGSTAGTTSALAGLSRTTAGLDGTNAQAFVRYRLAGSVIWQTAWSTRANAAVTTSIDLDNAVEIVCGIENDGSTADAATLALAASGSFQLTIAGDTPTVAAAANMDRYNGSYTIGDTTITMNEVAVPDGTLTIDAAARTISSSVAGPFYGSSGVADGRLFEFSDPDVWLEIAGSASPVSVVDGISASDVITHRNAWS